MASEIAAWKAVGLLVRPPGKAPFASSTIVRFFFLSAQTKEPEGKSLRPNESGLALNLCPQGQSFAGTVFHPSIALLLKNLLNCDSSIGENEMKHQIQSSSLRASRSRSSSKSSSRCSNISMNISLGRKGSILTV